MLKKIIYLIIIVILIIAGVYVANKISAKDRNVPAMSNNIVQNNVNTVNKNNVIEENNNIEEPQESKPEDTKQEENKNNSPEEKAKAIVKQNWGEDDTVYYSYDGIDNDGNYIICVRDKTTTKALFWYYVNINDGTFDIR